MQAPQPIVALAGGGTAWLGLGQPARAQQATGGAPVNGDGDPAVGTGSLTGLHNTPLHVGGIVIAAVAIVIALKVLGFRFVVGANVASGVG